MRCTAKVGEHKNLNSIVELTPCSTPESGDEVNPNLCSQCLRYWYDGRVPHTLTEHWICLKSPCTFTELSLDLYFLHCMASLWIKDTSHNLNLNTISVCQRHKLIGDRSEMIQNFHTRQQDPKELWIYLWTCDCLVSSLKVPESCNAAVTLNFHLQEFTSQISSTDQE